MGHLVSLILVAYLRREFHTTSARQCKIPGRRVVPLSEVRTVADVATCLTAKGSQDVSVTWAFPQILSKRDFQNSNQAR